ncbi:MAG: hypothetical protein AAGB04_19550 [Pseudomonadota bacterium]
MNEISAWLGLVALFTALQHFLSGAGETTPQVLEEAARGAAQAGDAISSGMNPIVAIGTALVGVLGVVARKQPDETPRTPEESEGRRKVLR